MYEILNCNNIAKYCLVFYCFTMLKLKHSNVSAKIIKGLIKYTLLCESLLAYKIGFFLRNAAKKEQVRPPQYKSPKKAISNDSNSFFYSNFDCFLVLRLTLSAIPSFSLYLPDSQSKINVQYEKFNSHTRLTPLCFI